MKRIGDDRLLSFDHGLAGIRHSASIPHLPEERPTPAAATQAVVQLDVLFETTSVDASLEAATLPDIVDRRVLEPAAYADALEKARRLLLEEAGAAAGERRAVLARALAVLDGAEGDRAVLDAARRALMRG